MLVHVYYVGSIKFDNLATLSTVKPQVCLYIYIYTYSSIKVVL